MTHLKETMGITFFCTTFAIMKTYVVNLLDHCIFHACEYIHLLWSGYPYMPAESHCSIMWPEPRPQRSEQLLQTQKHTGTHTKDMHTHTHAHKWKKKKNTKWKQTDGKHEAFHSKLVRWNHRYVQLVTQWHEGRKKFHLQFPSKRPTRWQMTARQIQIRQ